MGTILPLDHEITALSVAVTIALVILIPPGIFGIALSGLFWPSMMKMRAQHVPEEMRATIINFFRIPLNAFVCVVLYNVCPVHKCSCS